MKSQHYEQLVPAMLLVGGIVTLLIMYYDMKKLMPFRIGIDRIVRALALSLPFSAVMLFYGSSEDLAISICLVLLAGLYFLATQFYLSFRSRPAAGGAT